MKWDLSDDSLKSFRFHLLRGAALTESGAADYRELLAFTKQGVGGNFQSTCYFKQFRVGGALYFNFRDVTVQHSGSSNYDVVRQLLWSDILESVVRDRSSRVRVGAPFPGAVSLVDVLVRGLCGRLKVPYDDVSVERLSGLYLAYLARQVEGVVDEVRTFDNLVNAFGADSVRWAGHDEESDDVDLYLCGLPVSVKNGFGWSDSTLVKYRHRMGKVRPVLYVNADLACAVPVGDRFSFKSVAVLPVVVERLGGVGVRGVPVIGSFLDVPDDGFAA